MAVQNGVYGARQTPVRPLARRNAGGMGLPPMNFAPKQPQLPGYPPPGSSTLIGTPGAVPAGPTHSTLLNTHAPISGPAYFPAANTSHPPSRTAPRNTAYGLPGSRLGNTMAPTHVPPGPADPVPPLEGATVNPGSNEGARVAPPRTYADPYGNPLTTQGGRGMSERRPPMPPVGHMNVPASIGGQGQSIGGLGGQYAPPSLPPTQMPTGGLTGGFTPTLLPGTQPGAPAQHPPQIPQTPTMPRGAGVRLPGPYVPSPHLDAPLQYSGPFAPHAQTPAQLWTPEMHQQLNATLSPNTQLNLSKLAGQQQARSRAAAANTGDRGYGGMGQPIGYQSAQQKSIVDPALAAGRQQKLQNEYDNSSFNSAQLRLGGAKPELPPPPQTPPTLDPSSRFQAPRANGVNLLDSGTTAIRTPSGRGTALVGANAMAALTAQGFKPTDLTPGSPYYKQAQSALQKYASNAENERFAAATEARGGPIRNSPREYEAEKRDQMLLNRARLRGTGLDSPAVSAAAARETSRQEGMRDRLAGLSPSLGGAGGAMPLAKMQASAARVQKTPLGAALSNPKNTPTDIVNALRNAKKHASPAEWKDLGAWANHHRLLNPKAWTAGVIGGDPSADLDELFATANEGKTAPKKKPTAMSTFSESVLPPRYSIPGEPLYPPLPGGAIHSSRIGGY